MNIEKLLTSNKFHRIGFDLLGIFAGQLAANIFVHNTAPFSVVLLWLGFAPVVLLFVEIVIHFGDSLTFRYTLTNGVLRTFLPACILGEIIGVMLGLLMH